MFGIGGFELGLLGSLCALLSVYFAEKRIRERKKNLSYVTYALASIGVFGFMNFVPLLSYGAKRNSPFFFYVCICTLVMGCVIYSSARCCAYNSLESYVENMRKAKAAKRTPQK